MLRSISCAALTFALTAPPVLAAEKPPISLAKSSKWEMNYDKEACHLSVRFGEGDQSVIAKFTRFQPGDPFDLTLTGQQFKTGRTMFEVEIGFDPMAKPTKRFAAAGTNGNKVPVLIISSVRLVDTPGTDPFQRTVTVTPSQEGKIKSMQVKWSGSKSLRLETGPMSAPMEAMRICVDDLVASWGYNPAEQSSLKRRVEPIGSPANWITTGDYPSAAVEAGAGGLVQFRLDVGPDGKVAGCHILYRTRPDAFADLSCSLLAKRARFKAALDHTGTPVRSYFVSKVVWMSPD